MSLFEGTNPDVRADIAVNDQETWPGTTTVSCNRSIDAAQIKYQQARVGHWNEVARKFETWKGWGGYYHRRLTEIYQSLENKSRR